MRFLERFGHHAHFRDAEKLTLIRKGLAGPGFENNIQALVKALLGLAPGDAIAVELAFEQAPAHPKIQPAVGQQIDRGVILGDLDRVMPRQDADRRAQANPFGPRRDIAQQHVR